MTTSRWSRIAAAAAAVALVLVIVGVLDRTSSVAYALEQTLEANRGPRSFHERGLAAIVREPDMPAFIDELLAQVDPTVTMTFLHEARARGRITTRTFAPAAEGEPIRLVATMPGEPHWRDVYLIDPETKLVQRVERIARRDGVDELQRRTDYLAYNRPLDPGVFVLDLPDDVVLVDQAAGDVGLTRGEATGEAVAGRVARGLLEALVAGDHDRAGRLAGGLPADRVGAFMGERFGVERWLRVVSVGDAVRDAAYDLTGFLCVPCEVEVLRDGRTAVLEITLGIRPVEGRPDRWAFAGTCGD
ncbi:MAG: hypothetical protein ACYTG1_03070 [Planctomycetota bacterium]